MFLKSIRSSIAATTSVAITLVCVVVLTVALEVHEELYLDSVKKDFDGLSANLSNDLLPIMSAEYLDGFALTTALLRLDKYENVKFSAILNEDYEPIEVYAGKALSNKQEIDSKLAPEFLAKLPLGMSISSGELIAFKQIGEISFPQGYLLAVQDASTPLEQSKIDLLIRALPFAIVAIVLGIFLSFWQNHKLLEPLRKLASLAQRIKQTNDYSIDLNVQGKREVSDLSTEISSMMRTIESESNKNKEHTNQLKTQQQTLTFMANYDTLTGLPNRHNFLKLVAGTLQNMAEKNPALIYCDLDGFKAVNDLHGHEVGDKLLVAVSKRLKNLLHNDDIVSRIGGDEFLILLTCTDSLKSVDHITQRIVEAINKPFMVSGWELHISVSAGVAHAESADFDVNTLIANADIAMYRAKLNGKNSFAIFESGMMEANKRRLDIANAIPNAIKYKEFQVYYQAKVDQDKCIAGFEALIRWHSKQLGFVSPAEFISIAEQSGRISLITQFVIDQVCSDLAKLREKFGRSIVVALNLSVNDIKDPNLVQQIQASFRRHNVPTHAIEFEVTESAFLENFDRANKFFDEVVHMGCSVALDDFGTGYSSLSYLTKIRLNTLKIDKQFIDGIGISNRTTLITKTIIEMGKNLNLKVCAEGVETEQQSDFLLAAGCDYLQGYLYAKPQPMKVLLQHEITNCVA